jgi:radical SAM superfamily enzyme YgiQ (UPF0313 family)
MLLIHPPVAKPCEPPAGIARLAGVLRGHDIGCDLLDANLEGQLYLLAAPHEPADTWSSRACRNLAANLVALRRPQLYTNQARYQRAVVDVNRVLELAGRQYQVTASLANYQDEMLSPLTSGDLIKAAERPTENLFYPYFANRLPGLLEEKQPTMVGFSLNYLSQALCTFAMIGFLRENYPDMPVVLGGGLVTSWLRNPAWRNPFGGLVDLLVAGPGEGVLLDLLSGPRKGAANPQHLPPDYSGLPLDNYLAPGFILPYAASSGCYWNKCSFCPEKAEGNSYQGLKVERALDDIAQLVVRSGPVLLHFLDNAISPSLLKGLAERPPGVPWYSFARVSALLTDVDFCRALKQSGCVMLKLGLESGDQGVLDAMHKGIDLDMVSRALAALHAAGIATYVYLLFGTPAESRDAADRTLDFVARHSRAITFLNLAVFNMPISSPEARTLAIRDFYEGDLSLYTDFIHPHEWDRKTVRRYLDQEFKRHPVVAKILRRDSFLFTSNHAPFFC